MHEDDALESWADLLEHLQLFDRQIVQGNARAADVAAWAGQAVHQSVLDHVGHRHQHDGDGAGRVLGGSGGGDATRPDEDEIRAS